MSISSSASLSPDEIARKSFPATRKGVDGEAVRVFLTKVATELREVLGREALLREQLAEAERRAAEPVLDEATLTRAIGIETARILSTAHEAANNVVAKAEERAAELIGESERVLGEQVALAEAEASAIRSAAEQEAEEYAAHAHAQADALTDEAHNDAVELLDATKEECRRMVAEARDLRNRTLADLVSRRSALRVQLEELRGGKDSLLGVIESVASAVDTLRERLAFAEDQARIAAEEAGERVELQPGHDELVELEAELAATASALADVTVFAVGDESPPSVPSAEGGEHADKDEITTSPAEEAAPESGSPGKGTSASRRSVDELFARIRASRADAEVAAAEVPPLEPVGAEEPAEPKGEEEFPGGGSSEPLQAEVPGGSTDQVAVEAADASERTAEVQIHVAGTEAALPEATVVGSGETEGAAEAGADSALETNGPLLGATATELTPVGAGVEAGPPFEVAPVLEDKAVFEVNALDADAITEPDVESLARRDHLLGAVTAKLGRALKRALQDDQNELLNALRQTSRKPVLDELVPPDTQRERFVKASSDQLARAYEAGAAFLVTGDAVEGPSVSAPPPSEMSAFEAGSALAAELAADLSLVLRLRIEEALSELDGSLEGSADAAGIAYREWKGSRVEGLAGDFTTRAFAVGELAVLEAVSNADAPLVRWAVEDDDGGGSCPDCDDNSLAGPIPPGAAFPTGHSHPPVHPGCRCLLVPVRS